MSGPPPGNPPVSHPSGEMTRLPSSGNMSGLVSSGNMSRLPSAGNMSGPPPGNPPVSHPSGEMTRLPSSGNMSGLVSSGNMSRLPSAGNMSGLASSGNMSRLDSSGTVSRLPSSGNMPRLPPSGNLPVSATPTDNGSHMYGYYHSVDRPVLAPRGDRNNDQAAQVASFLNMASVNPVTRSGDFNEDRGLLPARAHFRAHSRFFPPAQSVGSQDGYGNQNPPTARSNTSQRFAEIYGEEPTLDVGSIDQLLSQSANLRAPAYLGQSASSGTSHLSPNNPPGYPPSFFTYQPNIPSVSSNQQSAASIARSASSNILSTSPSLSSGTHNISSAFRDLGLYPLPPRQGLENAPSGFGVTGVKKPVDPPFDQVQYPPGPSSPYRPQHRRSNAVQMPNLPPGIEPRYEFPARPLHGSGLTSPLHSETPELVLRADARRWFRVSEVATATPIHQIVYMFSASPTVDGPFLNAMSTLGSFYVGFTDLYEAQVTMDQVREFWPEWKIESVNRGTFDLNTQLVTNPVRGFEDLVQVFIYSGPKAGLTPGSLASKVKVAMELVGPVLQTDVVLFDEIRGARLTGHEVRVRFADCRYAMNAVKCMNGYRDEYSVFEVLPWSPHSDLRGQHWAWSKAAKRQAPSTPGGTEKKVGDAPSSEKSKVIDDDRIVRGIDARTTIMIKTLPRGLRPADLKRVLDETSLGRYNYTYLRMNFEENANLGYAFVNFVSPQALLEFVRARRGKAWPGAKGDEQLEESCCYANEQGIAPSIEKFRNSPVMLEDVDFRPKLYYTSGVGAGQEHEFPAMNNFYVLSRGVDKTKKGCATPDRQTPGTGSRRRRGLRRQSMESRTPTRKQRDPGTPASASRPSRPSSMKAPGTLKTPGSSNRTSAGARVSFDLRAQPRTTVNLADMFKEDPKPKEDPKSKEKPKPDEKPKPGKR